MSTSRLSSFMSCVVCARAKELDSRGYPCDTGSTVRASCGHHFCAECLLERIFSGNNVVPHEYRCELAGCGQTVAPFAILRNIGDGTEPFTSECAGARKKVELEEEEGLWEEEHTPPGTLLQATALKAVTAIESSTDLRQRIRADGGVRAQTVPECRLLSLPPGLLRNIWPAREDGVGLLVCKQLRLQLLGLCTSIDLVCHVGNSWNFLGCSVRLKFGGENFPEWDDEEELEMINTAWGEWGKEGKKPAGPCVRGIFSAKMLGECKALTHFRCYNLNDGEVEILAEVLEGCTNLVELYLDGNRYGDKGGIGDKGARRLARSLKNWKSLAVLGLAWNLIGPKGAGMLAGALVGSKALSLLDLTDNFSGDSGEEFWAGEEVLEGVLGDKVKAGCDI